MLYRFSDHKGETTQLDDCLLAVVTDRILVRLVEEAALVLTDENRWLHLK